MAAARGAGDPLATRSASSQSSCQSTYQPVSPFLSLLPTLSRPSKKSAGSQHVSHPSAVAIVPMSELLFLVSLRRRRRRRRREGAPARNAILEKCGCLVDRGPLHCLGLDLMETLDPARQKEPGPCRANRSRVYCLAQFPVFCDTGVCAPWNSMLGCKGR